MLRITNRKLILGRHGGMFHVRKSFRRVVDVSSPPFQSNGLESFFVNVLCVLLMYGSAYLANTGAMLFGKWIPDKTGMSVIIIDRGRNYSDGHRILGDGKSWNGLGAPWRLPGTFQEVFLIIFCHFLRSCVFWWLRL